MSHSRSAHEALTIIDPPTGVPWLDLRQVWDYRELLYFFVWRDVKVRYKQTVIGAGWAIIQPFCTMVLFSVFFGGLAGMPTDGLPAPVFYYSALVPWMYFAGAVTQTTNAIVDNQRIVTRVYFPRVILPLGAVLSGLADFAIAFAVLILLMLGYGLAPAPTVLLLPLFVALIILTALGTGLWTCALNARYRDVRYAVPFLVQLWMFASPVVYPTSLVPPAWRWVMGLNPMGGAIEGFRWAMLGRGEPPGPLLFVSAAAVLLVLGSGLAYFKRVEATIADVV